MDYTKSHTHTTCRDGWQQDSLRLSALMCYKVFKKAQVSRMFNKCCTVFNLIKRPLIHHVLYIIIGLFHCPSNHAKSKDVAQIGAEARVFYMHVIRGTTLVGLSPHNTTNII